MKSHILVVILILIFSSIVFSASGVADDGTTRVELVYITEIGDSNMGLGDGNIVDFASDELLGGTFTDEDENIVHVGAFFTDFEFTLNHIYITFINPACYGYNPTNLIRFNVYSGNDDPIGDINYVLNGNPGLDLNGFCTGPDSNRTCARLDPNIAPFVENTITVYADNTVDIEYATCDFNFNLSGDGMFMTPPMNMGIIILIIFGVGLVIIVVLSRRRNE